MNLQPIFDELFNPIIMQMIWSDHHKNVDGGIELYYNNYTQERVITHMWYVRWEIVAEAKTFTECSKKFIELVRDKNIDVIMAYYREEKWLDRSPECLTEGCSYEEIIEVCDWLIEEKFKNDKRYNDMLDWIVWMIKEAKDKWIEFDEDEVLEDQSLQGEEDFWTSLKYEAELWKLSEELKEDWIRVHTFIKDIKTWDELWSQYEWQFVARYNEEIKLRCKEIRCFIDDTRMYARIWWIQWIDREYIRKPLNMCVQRWTYGKDWKWQLEMKRIWELDKEHIEAILKTQKLKPSLKKLFKLTLKEKSST